MRRHCFGDEVIYELKISQYGKNAKTYLSSQWDEPFLDTRWIDKHSDMAYFQLCFELN